MKVHAEATELNALSLTEFCSSSSAFILKNNPLQLDHEYAEYSNDVQIISYFNNQSVICGLNCNTDIQLKKSNKVMPKAPYTGFMLPTAKRRKDPMSDADETYFAGTRAVTNESFFKFRSFNSWKTYEVKKTAQRIRNSDYVRIKNGNSYLILSETNNYEIPYFSFNVEEEYPYHFINSIFQIIETNPDKLQKGEDVLAFNDTSKPTKEYLLRHFISGKFIQLPGESQIENETENIDYSIDLDKIQLKCSY